MIKIEQAQELLSKMKTFGFDYAELFLERQSETSFSNFNNKRFTPSINKGEGTGIRCWKGKEVTYVSLNSIKYEDILKSVNELTQDSLTKENIDFKTIDGEFKNDNIGYSIEEIMSKLNNYINIAKQEDKIKIASAGISTKKIDRLIAHTDGSFIKKTSLYPSFNISVIAEEKDQKENMSDRVAKQLTTKEVIDLFDANSNKIINDITSVAKNLLSAPRIKSGDMEVILPSGFGAVLFHEAVGHPLEATQVAVNRSQFNGKLNEKVASEIVTLIDDGTYQNEYGSSKYDDEGIETQKRVLIEKGVLKDYLVDKYNGSVLMDQKPNGAGRRQNFRYNNTSRMSNTYIENGKSEVTDIISSTKKGFYAKKLGGGQVNPFTGQFNFGVSEGYLIENGEVKHLVKGATLIGNGIEAIKKIDMIANDFKIDVGTCGSSSGMIPVTVGQPTLRVSSMTVGGE